MVLDSQGHNLITGAKQSMGGFPPACREEALEHLSVRWKPEAPHQRRRLFIPPRPGVSRRRTLGGKAPVLGEHPVL